MRDKRRIIGFKILSGTEATLLHKRVGSRILLRIDLLLMKTRRLEERFQQTIEKISCFCFLISSWLRICIIEYIVSTLSGGKWTEKYFY